MNLFFTLNVLILALSLQSFAKGHETGNGGGAVVCRNQAGTVESVELLDLWEARSMGVALVEDKSSQEENLKLGMQALTKNNPNFSFRVRSAIALNNEIRFSVPSGVHLMPPTDTFHWMMKDNCALESVAMYRRQSDGERLYVNFSLLEKMSELDKAALWMHEAIYRVLREDDGDIDSIRTRELTARVFAKHGFPEVELPSVTCFHKLADNNSSYSFVAFMNFNNSRFNAWVGRSNEKWLVPSVPVRVNDKQLEQSFIKALNLDASDLTSGNIDSTILALPLVYRLDGKQEVLVGMLMPKPFETSGKVYSFSLSLDQKVKANCISK